MNATQTPQQEYQERAVEQAAAWLTIPQLSAVQYLREIWADARQRVKDDHTTKMEAIGGKATEAEDMGDITVSGDHTANHTHHHYPAPPSIMPAIVNKLAPYVLAAALGSAAPLAYLWWNKPTPQPAPQPPAASQDWQLGIEVVNP